jgi:hypothetical protein
VRHFERSVDIEPKRQLGRGQFVALDVIAEVIALQRLIVADLQQRPLANNTSSWR